VSAAKLDAELLERSPRDATRLAGVTFEEEVKVSGIPITEVT
jgi:hypothetical protein